MKIENLCKTAVLAFVLASLPQEVLASSGGPCKSVYVPVTVAGVPDAELYGELCMPAGESPTTVQLLVHGSTYNHFYWDWPVQPNDYSHVRAALEAGYATFNIDRLGSGRSTIPASNLVTLDSLVDTLHQVVVKLRAGDIEGRAFSKVVYFGHSLSCIYGWVLGSLHPNDIDAFVITGLLHFTRPSYLALVQEYIVSICTEPKFKNSGLDCGYLTTKADTRSNLYHLPNTTNNVLNLEEVLKDVLSGTLLTESVPFVLLPPPETAPSHDILVPTLLVLGDQDKTACGAPDGLDCTVENVLALEAPYYNPNAILDVHIDADAGHSMPMHIGGRETADAIHNWLDIHVGSGQ